MLLRWWRIEFRSKAAQNGPFESGGFSRLVLASPPERPEKRDSKPFYRRLLYMGTVSGTASHAEAGQKRAYMA
jgi:hypothetical protein